MNDITKTDSAEEKIILTAKLTKDNKIIVSIISNHIPSLAYVHKIIGVEIDKLIIDEQIKQRSGNNKIITPKKHGIIDFIRGRNG